MAVRARHPCSGCDVELEDCHRTSRGLALEPESDCQPPDPDLFAWSRQHESILSPRSFFREDASTVFCSGPRGDSLHELTQARRGDPRVPRTGATRTSENTPSTHSGE